MVGNHLGALLHLLQALADPLVVLALQVRFQALLAFRMRIDVPEEVRKTAVCQGDCLSQGLDRAFRGLCRIRNVFPDVLADIRGEIHGPCHAGGQAGRGIDEVACRVRQARHRVKHGIGIVEFHAQIDQLLAQVLQGRLRVEAVGIQHRHHRRRPVSQGLKEGRVDRLLNGCLCLAGNLGGNGVFLPVFVVDQRRMFKLQRHEAHDVLREIRRNHQRRVTVAAVDPL